MRKFFAVILGIGLLVAAASCGTPPEPEPQMRLLTLEGGIQSAWYTEETSEDATGDVDITALRVGRTLGRQGHLRLPAACPWTASGGRARCTAPGYD